MTAPAEPVYIFVECRNCGGRRLEQTATSWVCSRCRGDELHLVPEIQEGGDMGFKKHGTGEITETEQTTTAKTAAKAGEWTEDDNQALARENADADGED